MKSPYPTFIICGKQNYVSHSLTVKKTSPVKILIGQRVKPQNNGQSGFLRVDTVHQGDKEKEKGVYRINNFAKKETRII